MMSLPVWLPSLMFVRGGVSVSGPMFLPGGLCLVGSLSGGSVSRGGSMSRESLSEGVPVQGVGGVSVQSSGISVLEVSVQWDLCQGDTSILVKSRCYASYWNAFLF